jgi:signal transduction histidine kinase
MANGRQVGSLLAEPAGGGGARAGEQYLSSVNQAILWSGLIAIVIALFLGLLLARRITRPLSQLTEATHALAAGDLSRQVPVTSEDELGRLANDFNQMAQALNLSETQRRQLLADTAHDLRTPIAVIRSHLEAMLDGVFPMTPENLAAIHEETLHLSRLVEDVRLLSLAETGQLPLEKKPVDFLELTDQVVTAFAPLAEADGVVLQSDLQQVPTIMADEARLHQVLANLISNAMRFAPLGDQEPPTVSVTLQQDAGQVIIAIADNGPGLTAEQQAHVFDRFWRSDSARDRQGGNSGLGLAISKSIVEAHGGHITVDATPGQGTTFTIILPV